MATKTNRTAPVEPNENNSERKPDINQDILSGRVSSEITTRQTSADGSHVAKFTIATNHSYRGQIFAQFTQVVCFDDLAEVATAKLAKGRPVSVTGRLKTSKYQAHDGSTRWTTEVVATKVEA